MNGRNSTVISIRVSDSVYTILGDMASKKGLTVSAFIRGKVEEYTEKANDHSVNKVVNTTECIPLYNKAIHKAGDKVLIRQGKRLVESTVPELDIDGQPIP